MGLLNYQKKRMEKFREKKADIQAEGAQARAEQAARIQDAKDQLREDWQQTKDEIADAGQQFRDRYHQVTDALKRDNDPPSRQ